MIDLRSFSFLEKEAQENEIEIFRQEKNTTIEDLQSKISALENEKVQPTPFKFV